MKQLKKAALIFLVLTLMVQMFFTLPTMAKLPSYGEEYASQPTATYSEKFYDVKKGHWAFSYIMEMNARGILSGYPNGNFYPENTITRAEFAKIMCLAAGLNVSSVKETSYTDVKSSDWYAPYVEAGKYYLSGYVSAGRKYYMPNSNALREDIAVALVKLKGYDTSIYDESILKAMFTDWQSISEDARKYVSVAVENGLISGYDDDTFRGQATLTRAEAATLLWRAYQYGNGNKVFEKEEVDVPEEKETQKEEVDKLSLTLNASDKSITIDEGESATFEITVESETEGKYVPDISGDADILKSTQNITTKGFQTVCKYETKALEKGEYKLVFKITDDFKTHSITVKIKVKEVEKEDPLTLSLTANKTSYTIEEGESVDFKITVSSNIEGEYVPDISGDTDILEDDPDISEKGNVTIYEYTTEELDAGTYKLTFSIEDASQTHEKTIKITVNEPKPEYTYEMDTLVEGIDDVNCIHSSIATENSYIYVACDFDNVPDGTGGIAWVDRSNEVVYEITKNGKKKTLLDLNNVEYMGDKELSKREIENFSNSVISIGYNEYDKCPYIIFSQSYGKDYLYNLYTEDFVEYDASNVMMEGPSWTPRRFCINDIGEIVFCSKFAFDNTGIVTIDSDVFNTKSLCYINNRTGKINEVDWHIDNAKIFTANNKHHYAVKKDEIYTIDTNGDHKLIFSKDDIDNVDRRVLNFGCLTDGSYSMQYTVAADNEGTIYFYDDDYDSIRCIREK